VKDRDENHVACLADRACLVVCFPIWRIVDGGVGRRCHAEQYAAQRQFLSPGAVGQKTKLPDAHETARQDMKQKAPE
jgi:hypothetical protein